MSAHQITKPPITTASPFNLQVDKPRLSKLLPQSTKSHQPLDSAGLKKLSRQLSKLYDLQHIRQMSNITPNQPPSNLSRQNSVQQKIKSGNLLTKPKLKKMMSVKEIPQISATPTCSFKQRGGSRQPSIALEKPLSVSKSGKKAKSPKFVQINLKMFNNYLAGSNVAQ